MQNPVQPATMTAGTAVSLTNVSKHYTQWQRSGKLRDVFKNMVKPQTRTVRALDGVTLQIDRGEFVAYAGANGSGKSTTIKLLGGILQPTGGQVAVLGQNPARSRIELMRRIGIVFGQRSELWWDHPIAVSFDWKQAVWDIPKDRYERMKATVVDLLDLGSFMNTFARELSLGQRMRADLGLMLLHEPELILLDEPTLGLDVLAKRQMIDFLKRINNENGTTVVVTSHDMDDLEEMARRIVLLSAGQIAFDGSFDELRRSVGGQRRLAVTTEEPVAPKLLTARHIESKGVVHEYEFDADKVAVREVFLEASQQPGVCDLEVRRVPIESIVAELYKKWR
jgi:ABC-2 type transport system ATP-binding protein